ncbi:MAG: aspartate carbamoyltransferase regulatory subunit [Nanoarchaeota archaeon]
MKELKISAIRDGTVIDHIPAKNAFKVAQVLDLEKHGNVVSVATNLKSKKVNKKGIVKVGGRNITQDEANKIALLAPSASLSIIQNYNVVKKFKLNLPKNVLNIIKCNNPKCITNMETVPTKFAILKDDPLKARCLYCERVMVEGEIRIL